jgi:hypothetical protein
MLGKSIFKRLFREEGGFWNLLAPVAGSLLGGLFGGGKKKSSASPLDKDYQATLGTIKGMLPGANAANPELDAAKQWYNNVMKDNYSAYSPGELDQMYKSQSDTLINDVFKPTESRFSRRLANQGLSGSGAAKLMWQDKIMTPEKKQLGDLWNSLQAENRNLTRQDKSSALGMTGYLSSANPNLEKWLTYLNALSGKYSQDLQKQQINQAQANQNASGWGALAGNLLSSFMK